MNFQLPGAPDFYNVATDRSVQRQGKTKEIVVMSPYFRHVPRITPIGILTSALVWIAATVNAAQQDTDHFIVTVYSDSRGSQELLIGHYDAALTQIETSHGLGEANHLEAATSLCVAQMMAGRFDSARTACDEAVKTARSAAIATPTWGPSAGGAYQADVAIAYANRAVLHWLTDDTQSAASDLAQAKRFAPKADCVTRNLAALNAKDQTLDQFRLAR
jgi:tetratricopeptide (TPR) repeat protein